MHPIKSIQSHHQGWVIKNFVKTNYSKALKRFKDIHVGEVCFVIGNGPSLTAEDLEKLSQKDIPTFAFNRIFLI